MPAVRAFTSMTTALELGGLHAGWLSSVAGGEAIGEVVVDSPSTPGVQLKHLGAVRYEDIVVTCGAGMDALFWNALEGVLKGERARHSGALVSYDMNLVARERLEFADALITEVTFPQLDGASKNPALLRVTFAPRSTRRRAAGATADSRVRPGPKKFLQSNFRVAIAGLDDALKRVTKVRPLSVRRSSVATEISDLVLTVARTAVKPLETWHDDFVIKGTGTERTGSVELLAPNMTDVQLRLELRGLGIFRLGYDPIQPGTEQIAVATASIYCEQVAITRSPATP